jgi:PIN domain nuclease of toxin-antitoxin system
LLPSTASVWEIALKAGRGRWPDAAPVVGDIEAALRETSISPLPVSVVHARAAGLLDRHHRDPFDPMIAAQAIVEGAVLVTADRAFAALPLATLWD